MNRIEIDRVAKALHDAVVSGSWEDAGKQCKAFYRKLARTAIALLITKPEKKA